VLSQRTIDYQNWVEAFASNHKIPIKWAQKGVRKEDQVLPWLRRMRKKGACGVYFIFKSMEQGPTFRISLPRYPTRDPNHQILWPTISVGEASSFARLLKRPQLERLSCFKARIFVIYKLKLTLVTETAARFLFAEGEGVE
jgi:hypothetical protein